jgi:signal transduction histidine kinase/ubiquinone/menaquinone biosynthesis C-methylase UbiE
MSQPISTSVQSDIRRRQHLLAVLLPPIFFITMAGSIYYTISIIVNPDTRRDLSGWVNYFSVLVLVVAFSVAWFYWRRGMLTRASTILSFSGSIGFVFIVVMRAILSGLDALALIQFIFFGVALILIGLFSNIRWIIISTIIINIATASCILLISPLHPGKSIEAVYGFPSTILTMVTIIAELIISSFLIAQRSTYELVLHELATSLEQQQQIDELKDQFIAHVNHELRNPVMTMRGTVEYALLAHDNLSEPEQVELLRKALRVGDGLVRLLESILEVRTIENSDELALQPVLVRQALDDAIVLINPQDGRMSQRDLRVSIHPGLTVHADPVKLQQILANLLSNALKYTPNGTPIEVNAQALTPFISSRQYSTKSEMVEITVRDHGPGIPPDQISLLFRRFVRLPRDLGSNIVGSGLGLYLCRLFAESMGGHIWVESMGMPGDGTTFHLELPLAALNSTTSSVPAVPSAQPIQKQVRNTLKRLQPVTFSLGSEFDMVDQEHKKFVAARLDETSTQSPKKSIVFSQQTTEFGQEIGEHKSDLLYVVPNDLGESQRLDFQHFIFREHFRGNYLAPINHPQRILDIGTGTGRWAVEMAREFPNAEVIGIDIVSPKIAYSEPNIASPENYRFQLVNILEKLPFEDESFDYVHLRLVMGGGVPIDKWMDVLQEINRVTAPGGWIEFVESSLLEDGGIAVAQIMDWLKQMTQARGLDFTEAVHISTYLQKAGFINIEPQLEKLPFGSGGRLGHYLALDLFTGIRSLEDRLIKEGITNMSSFDEVMSQADVDVHSGQYQCRMIVHIAYGRRPLLRGAAAQNN